MREIAHYLFPKRELYIEAVSGPQIRVGLKVVTNSEILEKDQDHLSELSG